MQTIVASEVQRQSNVFSLSGANFHNPELVLL